MRAPGLGDLGWRLCCPPAFVLSGWLAMCAPVAAQGLSADSDALAPNLLTVPGEAMLLDPPAPAEPSPAPATLGSVPLLGASADEVEIGRAHV